MEVTALWTQRSPHDNARGDRSSSTATSSVKLSRLKVPRVRARVWDPDLYPISAAKRSLNLATIGVMSTCLGVHIITWPGDFQQQHGGSTPDPPVNSHTDSLWCMTSPMIPQLPSQLHKNWHCYLDTKCHFHPAMGRRLSCPSGWMYIKLAYTRTVSHHSN